jgi:hypothetical protein
MSQEKGPLRVNAKNLAAAHTPPIEKPGLPAEVVLKYRSNAPLRRPAAARRHRTEATLQIAPAVVNQGLDAVSRGDTTDVRAEARELTVRIVPAVRDAVQQSGLTPDEMARLFDRLANALGSEETITKLPQVDATSDLRVHKTVIGRKGTATIFRFVIALVLETSAVAVVACFTDRVRTD